MLGIKLIHVSKRGPDYVDSSKCQTNMMRYIVAYLTGYHSKLLEWCFKVICDHYWGAFCVIRQSYAM